MKHKLPIAILIVAAAAAVTGVISFKTGVFQTASVGELMRAATTPYLRVPASVSETVGVNNPMLATTDSATGSTSSECTSSTKPWIRVLSPNGNETYTPGHKITVKWASCNIASTNSVHVSLIWKDSKNGTGGSVRDATANDNQEVLALPTDIGSDRTYKSGKLYKIQIVESVNGTPNYTGTVDTSDDYFSITSKN